jgi:hypothetical protein
MAVDEPAVGDSHRSPVSVRTTPALVEPVRDILRAAGIAAGVDEVLPPDWAEDALGELAAHLMGRPQVADPPSPAAWALLYQQAAVFVRVAPWERCADDVRLRLDVKVGAERSAYHAIVLGNAGVSRGLALIPGGLGASAFLNDAGDSRPPLGSCHLTLVATTELPDDVLERAGRYGWPDQSELPLFLAVGEDGPQEIDRRHAELLTIALAAVIEHDRADAGEATTGELILASGRRARFRAHVEAGEPIAVPPGVQVFSGEVRDDLLPEGAVIGVGGLPWTALAEIRGKAALHLEPPQLRHEAGDGLPLLILGLDEGDGRRVAGVLHAAHPEGVALLEVDGDVSLVIVTSSGLHHVTTIPAHDVSVTRFRERMVDTAGWHGIVVSTRTGDRADPVYGFFECVLAQPDAPTRGGPSRRPVRRAKRRRR